MREESGLSQAVLADRLKVNRTLVTKGEGGVRRLDVIELRAWLAATGMDLKTFVGRLEARLARNAKPAQNKRAGVPR